jgi:hypothetical protein
VRSYLQQPHHLDNLHISTSSPQACEIHHQYSGDDSAAQGPRPCTLHACEDTIRWSGHTPHHVYMLVMHTLSQL